MVSLTRQTPVTLLPIQVQALATPCIALESCVVLYRRQGWGQLLPWIVHQYCAHCTNTRAHSSFGLMLYLHRVHHTTARANNRNTYTTSILCLEEIGRLYANMCVTVHVRQLSTNSKRVLLMKSYCLSVSCTTYTECSSTLDYTQGLETRLHSRKIWVAYETRVSGSLM